jgi:hypothetical protein
MARSTTKPYNKAAQQKTGSPKDCPQNQAHLIYKVMGLKNPPPQ